MIPPITYINNSYRWLKNPCALLDKYSKAARTFRLRLPILGQTLLTGDPELIGEIARRPELTGGRGIQALRSVLGERSLITLSGEDHQRRRALLAPSFQEKAIRPYDKYARAGAIRALKQTPGAGNNAYELTLSASLDAIIQTLFGPRPEEEMETIRRLTEDFLGSFQNPLVLFLPPLQKSFGGRGPWGRAMTNRARLLKFIRSEIEKPHRTEHSILDDLLARRDQTFTSEDVELEILALLMFGHDTGAATMAWVMTHILGDEIVRDKVRQELKQVRARDEIPGPENLPYLNACLRESMRLAPVVIHLTRVATDDIQLGPYSIRAGEAVLPSSYLAGRNPAVYPQPDLFRPERFLEKSPDKYAFFPFGLGNRLCVGKPLVERWMVIIIATIMETAGTLRLPPEYQARPRRRLVLMLPEGGAPLIRDESGANRDA